MKEITRVHLAKTGYDIEMRAKKELDTYLGDIERMMGSEEAMYEIEARMVELLGERGVKAGGVITLADAAALRETMGEPREFSDGEVPEESEAAAGHKPAKRLMRDPDHAVLGGVCAGIAAYWNISPLWIRILFIISPFISLGTSLLIYIVLWVSLPEAKTAAEKLQMRGEEVTLDSLKNFSSGDESTNRKTTATKIVQIFVAFMLLSMTFGLLVALMLGLFAGFAVIPWMDGLAAQPWTWALFAACAVGGAAAVTLSGVLASSAIRWKFSRASLVTIIVTTVIGAMSVSGAAIFGIQAARELARDEQRLSRTVSVDLPSNLEGVKYVDVNDGEGVAVDVRGSASAPKVEVHYWAYKNAQPPKVTTEVRGDTLHVDVEKPDTQSCEGLPWVLHPGASCWSPARISVEGLYLKPQTYSHGMEV